MKPEQVFKQHKSISSFFETSDGTKFFTENLAQNHAKSLGDKSVKEVKKAGLKSQDKKSTSQDKLDAPARIAVINALETTKEVETVLKGEKAKTVLEAGAERIKAIEAAASGSGEGASTQTNDNN